MYHHVGADKLSNSPLILEKHFQHIKDNFNVVLPGETLAESTVNICIVFDDASYSFYHYAFPLIKKTGIRAVLAVSPKFIAETAGEKAPQSRLQVPAYSMMDGDTYMQSIPFCTWQELTEISDSGFVKIASHSYSHRNLLASPDVENEVVEAKRILQERIGREVDTFVYPYGRFNSSIRERVRRFHAFSFAVGAGDNKTWNGVGGVLFRMYADNLSSPSALFSGLNLARYKALRYRLFVKKWFMDRTPSMATPP